MQTNSTAEKTGGLAQILRPFTSPSFTPFLGFFITTYTLDVYPTGQKTHHMVSKAKDVAIEHTPGKVHLFLMFFVGFLFSFVVCLFVCLYVCLPVVV